MFFQLTRHGDRARALLSVLQALLLGVGAFAVGSNPVDATTVAGRTAGSFAVSPTGAATYTIPIWSPPGPHGIEPSIALTYNSQQGGGYVGVGWGISGLSSIYRCNLTSAQDASPAPVALVTSDGYCMDGQRLRLTSGTYGTAPSTYQTEVANFINVTAYGTAGNGPAYWIAQDRYGRTYTYGAGGTATNAQVLATGTSTAIAWELNEVSDPSSNTMTIAYNTTTGSPQCVSSANVPVGSAIPCTISWTPTSHGSSSYTYTMNLVYGANVNPRQGYVAGTSFVDPSLLGSVTINYSGSTIKKYVLSYQYFPPTNRELLTQLQECSDSTATNCLAPTSISYQRTTTGVTTSAKTALTGTHGAVYSHYDLNGDGYPDLIYSNGTNWYVAFGSQSGYGTGVNTGISASTTVLPGDLLGSGKAGILAKNGSTWYYYTWNGTSFTGASTNLAYSGAAQYVLADVNGDGLPDLVALTYTSGVGSGSVTLSANLNTGAGGAVSFGSAATAYSWSGSDGCGFSQVGIASNSDTVNTLGKLEHFDFDGDGRQDLILWYVIKDPAGGLGQCNGTIALDGVTLEMLSSGNSFTAHQVGPIVTSPSTQFAFLDWNSDGCTDFIANNTIYLSGCNGSTPATIPVPGTIIGAMDWNGDGRTDILVQNSGYFGVYLSTGNGVSSLQSTSIPYSSSTVYFTFDADGDGMEDLGYVTSSGSVGYYVHNNAGQPPDLMTSVSDGYGNSASPSYASLVLSSYTKATDRTYPYQSYIGPMYVVNKVIFSDPSSTSAGTYNQTFSYTGAWTHLQGRGFLGFEVTKSLDSRNSLWTARYYDIIFPYTGILDAYYLTQDQAQTKFVKADWVNRVSTVLDPTQYNERYFVYLNNVTFNDYEVSANAQENALQITTSSTNYTYDNYGNPTQIVTTLTDNDPNSPYLNQTWTTTTTNTPDVDTTHWCLGLFTETQVAYASSLSGSNPVTRTKTFPNPDTTNCRYTQIVTEPNSSQFKVTENIGYDAFGNVNSDSVTGVAMGAASPATRTITSTWTSSAVTTGQFPMTVIDPTGAATGTTTYSYNLSYGLESSVTDPNNLTTSWQYTDGFGRLTRETRPDGTYTTVTYGNCATDGLGCLVGLNGTVINYGNYGSNGTLISNAAIGLDQVDRQLVQLSEMLSGSDSRVDTRYDPLGRVSQSSLPCAYTGSSFTTPCTYWVTDNYDVLDRLIESQRPVNASSGPTSCNPITIPPALGCQGTAYSYAGRTTTATDALSNTTSTIRDVNGWLRRTTDAYGYYVTTAYDAAGSRTSVTDSLGNPLWSGTYSYGLAPYLTSVADMDMGANWSFTVDALGEVTAWMDAKGQPFSATYDGLSRLTSRTEPDPFFSLWTWGSSPSSHNIGKLQSACAGPSGTPTTCNSPTYTENESYDSAGRLSLRSTVLGSTTYTYTLGYNPTSGLLSTLTYPTSTNGCQVAIQYAYTNGFLASVTDASNATQCGSTGTVFWAANAMDPAGHVTKETLGTTPTSLVTTRSYDAVTGWLGSLQSGLGGGAGVKNLGFGYDYMGNLNQRQDNSSLALTENIYYDNDYRFKYSQLVGAQNPSLSLTYDSTGNVTSRSDIANGAAWTYDSVHKHEVTQAGSSAYQYAYDGNGNVTSRQGDSITWFTYNYPNTVHAGSGSTAETVSFSYGPDRLRWQQMYVGNGMQETTNYIGGMLELVSSGSATNYRHYIYAGGVPVAIYSRTNTGNTFYYLLSDHQGSVASIVSSSGTQVVGESFDAFGNRRNPTTWSGPDTTGDLTSIAGITRQGYTFQTALGLWMGMNHMNGRVEDSTIGRMLSADPYITSPTNAQSYNHYSYVNNNPLTYTDPSGFFCNYISWGPSDITQVPDPDNPGETLSEVPVNSRDGMYLCDDVASRPESIAAPILEPVDSGPDSAIANVKLANWHFCPLGAANGQYRVAPPTRGQPVDARFDPTTAAMLSTALENLNQQGITPVITSAFRTPAQQAGLLTANSSDVITPARVSWHEVGAAVDFGPRSNAGNFPAIVSAMTQAGFVWGGTFHTPDVPHFQPHPPGTSPDAAQVQACASGGH